MGEEPPWGERLRAHLAHALLTNTPLAALSDRRVAVAGSHYTVNVGWYAPEDWVVSHGPTYRQAIDLRDRRTRCSSWREASRATGCLIGICADISSHQEAETELRRLNRTHAVLSRCNRSLARATAEREILDAFCTNLVEVGGYSFAWVGYAGRKPDDRRQGGADLAETGNDRS